MIGGQPWAQRVLEYTLQQPGNNPEVVQALYRQALEMAASDHAWVNQHARYTLDEVLADFKARGVPY